MTTDSDMFGICLYCASTDCIDDYPTKGRGICAKCGLESAKIKLKKVETSREMSDKCPFCGKDGEDDDLFFENDNLIIFKCKKCGKLDGYKFPFAPTDYFGDLGGANDPRAEKIAEREGSFSYPASKYKEFAKALKKRENDPSEICKRQLKFLVKEKSEAMNTSGIGSETIEKAEGKVFTFIIRKGPFTEKQLESLVPAAICVAQDALIRLGEIPKKELTERKLENIFDTDRKTIIKWKRLLEEPSNL